MAHGCRRCQEKKLRCFVDAVSGQCASCIAVHADCSLFVLEEEWESVQSEKEVKRLELLRARERQAAAAQESARLERELAEVEAKERSFATRDQHVLAVMGVSQEGVSGGTESIVSPEPPLSEPLPTDLGWLQDDFACFELFDSSLLDFDPVSGGSGGSPVPVSCSS